jgi:hypothetical protein
MGSIAITSGMGQFSQMDKKGGTVISDRSSIRIHSTKGQREIIANKPIAVGLASILRQQQQLQDAQSDNKSRHSVKHNTITQQPFSPKDTDFMKLRNSRNGAGNIFDKKPNTASEVGSRTKAGSSIGGFNSRLAPDSRIIMGSKDLKNQEMKMQSLNSQRAKSGRPGQAPKPFSQVNSVHESVNAFHRNLVSQQAGRTDLVSAHANLPAFAPRVVQSQAGNRTKYKRLMQKNMQGKQDSVSIRGGQGYVSVNPKIPVPASLLMEPGEFEP